MMVRSARVYPVFAMLAVIFALTASCSHRPAALPPVQSGGEVTIGHAGMLTALVNGVMPALAQHGIAIRSVQGNSLTVAGNIKNGTMLADLFGSADANANQLLIGPTGGNKVSWHCCIKATGVLTMIQSNKTGASDPWKTMTNPAAETS